LLKKKGANFFETMYFSLIHYVMYTYIKRLINRHIYLEIFFLHIVRVFFCPRGDFFREVIFPVRFFLKFRQKELILCSCSCLCWVQYFV